MGHTELEKSGLQEHPVQSSCKFWRNFQERNRNNNSSQQSPTSVDTRIICCMNYVNRLLSKFLTFERKLDCQRLRTCTFYDTRRYKNKLHLSKNSYQIQSNPFSFFSFSKYHIRHVIDVLKYPALIFFNFKVKYGNI